MKELIERSRALRDTILRDPALLKDLSEAVASALAGKVELAADSVYVLAPKVYRRPIFRPEIYMTAIGRDLLGRIPFPGPLDPWVVHILEKDRIEVAAKRADPTPEPAAELREQILRNPPLFAELSEAIAAVLQRHGVALAPDETYGFEAVTLRRPIFSTEVATPTIPIPPPALAAWRAGDEPVPIRRWFEGIPAVEMLAALERLRLANA